ncbi:uncharacterized protein STEHIDRAFT_121370 [Stereum hirsutum FP-91666 SS1]|uniref:uncharacterized protein n=1 Tax=Stereum hirsutum (strain FP-91666) TaxID=721885 RepID=UPI000440DF69|nr:uncharacterized protein STEHIDRAFT_121370 [Stereum hirsutum FP-91666 SS1]EIM86411.1 hypothetical protein STEHIDRAFT_121370 [Stereum hirsutum FP-91666 SS1]
MDPSIFSGLPYFNPFMMINTSGTCATTRLVQCRDFGVMMNDVSRKFDKDPEDVPDLSRDDFVSRQIVLKQTEGIRQMWTPILYMYEIVKASAKRQRDWGHLCFTDMTTTRFFLVMIFPSTCNCGNYSHHDYAAVTKYHADKFFSLLTLLWHNDQPPNWVRATYTTPDHAYRVDPTLLTRSDSPPTTTPNNLPQIIEVNSSNFVPSILPSEVEKVENLLAQKGPRAKKISEDVKKMVQGTKQEIRPDVNGQAWKQKNARQCAACEAIKEKDLATCSRCKLVYYCSKECQKEHWPRHKIWCKKSSQTPA